MAAEGKLRRIVNGVRIEDLSPEREQEALQFIRENFYQNAVIASSVGMDKDPESIEFYEPVLSKCIRDELCVAAIDELTKEIIGIIFLVIEHKGNITPVTEHEPLAFGKTRKLVEAAKEKVNLFKEYNVDSLANLTRFCVRKDYSGRKLGLNLVEVAVEKAKLLGIPLVEVVSDCNASRIIAEKVGMKQWSEVKYSNYKLDGEVLVPESNSNKSVVVMAMRT